MIQNNEDAKKYVTATKSILTQRMGVEIVDATILKAAEKQLELKIDGALASRLDTLNPAELHYVVSSIGKHKDYPVSIVEKKKKTKEA